MGKFVIHLKHWIFYLRRRGGVKKFYYQGKNIQISIQLSSFIKVKDQKEVVKSDDGSKPIFEIISGMNKSELQKIINDIPKQTSTYGNEVKEDQVALLVEIINRGSMFPSEITTLPASELRLSQESG